MRTRTLCLTNNDDAITDASKERIPKGLCMIIGNKIEKVENKELRSKSLK